MHSAIFFLFRFVSLILQIFKLSKTCRVQVKAPAVPKEKILTEEAKKRAEQTYIRCVLSIKGINYMISL